MNETQDEEPSVTDNSVINFPSYFKLFKFGKNFLDIIDGTYERACMTTPQINWDTSVIRYRGACMLDNNKNYYVELSNTITTFN